MVSPYPVCTSYDATYCSIAGAETTATTLTWWMLAMIAFPEVQRPHAATEEDWYEGMYIPKGTVCIANIWHCNRDRSVFGEDADEFRPERHLDENREPLPGPVETNQAGHVGFGFGRRICAGKDLATESLFIDTVRVLWAAKLEGARDENGEELPLDIETMVDAGAV